MTRRSMKDLEMHVALLALRLGVDGDKVYVDQSRPDVGYRVLMRLVIAGNTVTQSVYGEPRSVTQLYDLVDCGIKTMNAYEMFR